jgi:hypothetical protein
MQWAYALRDAAALARPDVLVSHWDPTLEADALAAALPRPDGDWVARLLAAPALRDTGPARATVELVATLTELFRAGPPVAATISGPVSVAAALAPSLLPDPAGAEERIELADLCADLLAALIGAYGDAGASIVLVLEHDPSFVASAELAGIHAPLLRAMEHQQLEAVLVEPSGAEPSTAGYRLRALPWEGPAAPPAVALVSRGLWALAPEQFAERFSALLAATADADVLIVSDGPLPADMPLENLSRAQTSARM